MAKEYPSIRDCAQKIREDTGENQYSFAAFLEYIETPGGSNCVVFAMPEQIIRAFNDMRFSIPESTGGVKISAAMSMTANRSVCVCRATEGDEPLSCIAKGIFDESLLGDTPCYFPEEITIRVMRDGINLEIPTPDSKEPLVVKTPGKTLLSAIQNAMKADLTDIEKNAERIFERCENAPVMSPR